MKGSASEMVGRMLLAPLLDGSVSAVSTLPATGLAFSEEIAFSVPVAEPWPGSAATFCVGSRVVYKWQNTHFVYSYEALCVRADLSIAIAG